MSADWPARPLPPQYDLTLMVCVIRVKPFAQCYDITSHLNPHSIPTEYQRVIFCFSLVSWFKKSALIYVWNAGIFVGASSENLRNSFFSGSSELGSGVPQCKFPWAGKPGGLPCWLLFNITWRALTTCWPGPTHRPSDLFDLGEMRHLHFILFFYYFLSITI